jgi:hypothetical protein
MRKGSFVSLTRKGEGILVERNWVELPNGQLDFFLTLCANCLCSQDSCEKPGGCRRTPHVNLQNGFQIVSGHINIIGLAVRELNLFLEYNAWCIFHKFSI